MIEVAWIMVSHGWPFYGVVILVGAYEWITRNEECDCSPSPDQWRCSGSYGEDCFYSPQNR